MSRSAIIVSLTLHAGLLFLVGWRSSWTAARIGPGHAGADASFFADEAAGPLCTVPAGPAEPVAEPQLAEPDFIQPPPAVIIASTAATASAAVPVLRPAVSSLPRELPAAKVGAAASRNGQSPPRGPARSGGNSGGQTGAGAGAADGGGRRAGYVPPHFLIRYKPLYPEAARAQRLDGTVLLLVSIDAAGHVTGTNVQRSCGHAVLDRAALAAVRSWRFGPARQDGVALAARVEVPVRFRYEERSAARDGGGNARG